MYPDTAFLVEPTGVLALTPEGYDAAIGKVVPAAVRLAEQGAAAITVLGTSLTFYRGPEAHAQLLAELREATGLPTSTMSQAVVDALHEVGARRVAVATAYIDVVNAKLGGIMTRAFEQVLAMAEREDVDMRLAAYLLAVDRVASATALRGLYP